MLLNSFDASFAQAKIAVWRDLECKSRSTRMAASYISHKIVSFANSDATFTAYYSNYTTSPKESQGLSLEGRRKISAEVFVAELLNLKNEAKRGFISENP